MSQTNPISNRPRGVVFAAMGGALVLALFLGWRGSRLVVRSQELQVDQEMRSEVSLSQGLIADRLRQIDADLSNVLSAEYQPHSGKDAAPSAELLASPFAAVGILELRADGFAPLWWSIHPKARENITPELLRGLVPEWQMAIQQMGRHYFIRSADLHQEPLMIVLSRMEIPGQASAIAVAAVNPEALRLEPRSLPESLLWDQKGHVWAYRNVSYVGSTLKGDALVKASLRTSTDSDMLAFNSDGRSRFGLFAQVPDTNLFFGMYRDVPSTVSVLLSWWASLVFGLFGVLAITMALVKLMELDEPEAVVAAETETSVWRPHNRRRHESVEIDPLELPPPTRRRPEAVEEDPLESPPPSAEHEAAAEIQEDSVEIQTQSSQLTPEEAPEQEEVSEPATNLPATNLETVVHRAVAGFRARMEEAGIEVNENLATGVQVRAKPAQLQTAIEEIIKNAMDAMAETELRRLIVETGVEEGHGFVRIRDSGSGIPSDHRDRIFEPFFSSHPDRSRGLGLTVVKRLLELVNGQYRIESEPGRGTDFVLMIPMLNVHVTAAPAKKAPASRRPLEFDADEELSSFETMSVEQVRDIAKKVEVRRPKVRMFD